MSEVSFTAYVKPAPQGSMKPFYNKALGRAILTTDNKNLMPYRHTLAAVAHDKLIEIGMAKPMAGKHVPVELSIEWTFLRPTSAPKRRIWHVVKPDVDKLERATLDALTGILWADDAQVVIVSKMKSYGPVESVHVQARTINGPGKLLKMESRPATQGVLL